MKTRKLKKKLKRPHVTTVQFPRDIVEKAKVLCVRHGLTNGEYIVAKVAPIIEREFKRQSHSMAM
jgi:hypothetical protein